MVLATYTFLLHYQLYVPVQVILYVLLWFLIGTLMHCLAADADSQGTTGFLYPLQISVEKLSEPIFDSMKLAGLRSCLMLFYYPQLLFLSLLLFSLTSNFLFVLLGWGSFLY